jgi:hypothetical protein
MSARGSAWNAASSASGSTAAILTETSIPRNVQRPHKKRKKEVEMWQDSFFKEDIPKDNIGDVFVTLSKEIFGGCVLDFMHKKDKARMKINGEEVRKYRCLFAYASYNCEFCIQVTITSGVARFRRSIVGPQTIHSRQPLRIL